MIMLLNRSNTEAPCLCSLCSMHSKSLHEGIVTTSSKWQNPDSDQVDYTSQITTLASADTKIYPVSLTPEWRCVDSAIGNWGSYK